MKFTRPTSLFIAILLAALLLAAAAPALAAGPVVRAVLFYSPTCPHCHVVMEEVLPPLVEQYQDQLEIVAIDVTTQQGNQLYMNYLTAFNVPNSRFGVPALVVGDTVLVGSGEIPEQFPGIIETGLASGGIDLPVIPGLAEALAASQAAVDSTAAPESVQISQANGAEVEADPEPAPGTGQAGRDENQPSFIRKFLLDPVGNSIAVVVLVGMLASAAGVGYKFIDGEVGRMRSWPVKPGILVLSLVGLFAAGYLTYVEASQAQAVCGPVGDCNAVQQSKYAVLFGVLPVGLLGVAGYIGILVAWWVQYFGPANLRRTAALALWGMAWFGVIFSIYLTFLEPFVIGATCMWCITSAVVMTLILWLSTPPALETMQA